MEGSVTSRADVLGGKPCIAGTRISVELILEDLSTGSSVADIARAYRLTEAQVRAALAYAATRFGGPDLKAAG